MDEGSNYFAAVLRISGKGEEDTRHLDQIIYIPSRGVDEIGERAKG
jgi:hypothetical protein